MQSQFHLRPREANHRPLTPLDLLDRAVAAQPQRPAVAWRGRIWTYGQFEAIVGRFAASLVEQGIKPGDVVSIMSRNRPELLAAHYAVPLVGGVLGAINTRLDTDTVRHILEHSGSRLLIADPACLPTAVPASVAASVPLRRLRDVELGADGLDFLDGGATAPLALDHRSAVADEWQPICINYTSGTTGKPKGAVYHHRGAYLNALGNVLALQLSARSVYLWTLPMFHCSGWCHTWAVTAAGGLHVCLDRVEPELIFSAMDEHGVTHLSCAPVVLYMLSNHPLARGRDASRRVTIATGGASPTSALIEQMDALGFDLIHLYGLTESFGPVTMRALDEAESRQDPSSKAVLLSRQGVRHLTANRVRVVDAADADVARDGRTIGEIVLKGNTLMAGYHDDPEATEVAFRGGHFRTGDLAVVHPNGDIEIRDRSKDVIISGGENISSLEVENVLHQHPAVLIAAVVASPDPKWGEVPCAFIEPKMGVELSPEELGQFCRQRLAGFKVPKRFVFQELPKTATGKIQKYALREQASRLSVTVTPA